MPVHAFTPIIGTLLLAHNAAVGAATRFAVIDILRQIREADAEPVFQSSHEVALGPDERQLLKQEILQQIVIGIGRLDLPEEGDVYDESQYPSEDDPAAGQNAASTASPIGVVSTPNVGSSADSPRLDETSFDRPSSPSLPELSRHDTPSSTDSVKTPEGDASSSPVYMDAYPRIQVQTSDMALDDPSRIAGDASLSGRQVDSSLSLEMKPSESQPSLVTAASEDSMGISSTDVGAAADDSDGVEAALGRLSSMSLMAAVSAGGAYVRMIIIRS